MRLLLCSIVLLFCYCCVDISSDTVESKSLIFTGGDCIYTLKEHVPFVKFIAPCDCYDIGDSLNKYYCASQKKKN